MGFDEEEKKKRRVGYSSDQQGDYNKAQKGFNEYSKPPAVFQKIADLFGKKKKKDPSEE